jgi:hypothetical protein
MTSDTPILGPGPKHFAPEVYISVEDEGSEDEYLGINKLVEDAADQGKKKRVGVYRFVRELIVEMEVKTTERTHPADAIEGAAPTKG